MVSTKDTGVRISTSKLPSTSGRPIRNDSSTNEALGGNFQRYLSRQTYIKPIYFLQGGIFDYVC